MMKKIILFIAVMGMVFSLSACSGRYSLDVKETEQTTISETSQKDPEIIKITAEECFGSMYYELITEKSGTYSFSAKSSSEEWEVYIFDEEFKDGWRYISQASTPVLKGDGEIEIAEGKYVYIYCPINAFTSEYPDEKAYLEISVKE